MFNINDFKANINQSGGLANKSHYLAVVSPPPSLNVTGLGVTSYHLALRMDSFEFPSRSVAPIEYVDYGPVRPIGGQANFTEVSSSILMSSDLREREFFMRWQDLIVGNHREYNLSTDELANQFDVGYFDNYRSGLVEIRQYDSTSRNLFDYTYAVRLIDVFPQIVGSLDTSWDQGDEFQRMNVTFSYRNFTEDFRLKSGTWKDMAQDFFLTGTQQKFEQAILQDLEPGLTKTLNFIEGINQDTIGF